MAREPKVHIPNMTEHLRKTQDLARDRVNQRAHEELHGIRTIVYTSKATLAAEQGTPGRFSFGGSVVRVACKLKGAPSGDDFEVDLLIDGVSVFDGTNLKVLDGETVSQFKIIERPNFNEDSTFVVEVKEVGGATGPFVMTIDYISDL